MNTPQVLDAKPHVKIVLCTTTCVDLEAQVAVEYGIYRSNKDVAAYNEVMREVVAVAPGGGAIGAPFTSWFQKYTAAR